MGKSNGATKGIIGIVIIIALIIFAYTLYCVVYRAAKESDFAYLGDYTTYILKEDNMKPDYSNGDLLILRRDTYYTTGDAVVFNRNNNYRLAKVTATTSSKVLIDDNIGSIDIKDTTKEDIAGTVVFRLGGFGKIFKALTSVYSMVIIGVIVLVCIFLPRE